MKGKKETNGGDILVQDGFILPELVTTEMSFFFNIQLGVT